LGAKGSHVVDDSEPGMLITSVDATLRASESAKVELLAAYVAWFDVDELEPILRRQNLRVPGPAATSPLALDYRVVDLVARLRTTGRIPTQWVAEYCWNTEADTLNKGIWAAAILGN